MATCYPRMSEKHAMDNPAFEGDEGSGEMGTRNSGQLYTAAYKRMNLHKMAVDESREVRMKTWDVFSESPQEGIVNHNDDFYNMCYKVLRIVVLAFLFIFVLIFASLAKGTLLFMTSQILGNSNTELPDLLCSSVSSSVIGQSDVYSCVTLPAQYSIENNSVPQCIEQEATYDLLITKQCPSVTVRWTWGLYLLLVTPYILTVFRSLWMICLKQKNAPAWDTVLLVMFIESLHTFGVLLLAFRVLPSLDNILEGLFIMMGVFFLPSLLNIFDRPEQERMRPVKIVMDILAFLAQVGAVVFLPIMLSNHKLSGRDTVWAGPLSLCLISIGWWENYINHTSEHGGLRRHLLRLRKRIERSRTKLYLVVGLWKVFISFIFFILINLMHLDLKDLFDFSSDALRCGDTIGPEQISAMNLDWLWAFMVGTISGIGMYFSSRSAAKILAQEVSLALPLLLVTPVLGATFVGMCEYRNSDVCYYSSLPLHVFFKCYPPGQLGAVFSDYHWWVALIWYLSQIWITRHLWYPGSQRLAHTASLFVLPLYDGIVLDQSIAVNRRKVETNLLMGTSIYTSVAFDEENQETVRPRVESIRTAREHYATSDLYKRDRIPMVYICATMWHETEAEMISMLKSIYRLDVDQNTRKNVQILSEDIDPDFYNFEAHIFFDDAMEARDHNEWEYKVNDFVKSLVKVIDVAAQAIYNVSGAVPPPTIIPAPYGGQLVWNMPGGNVLIAHLKDKNKIRHKKRWSQVMYMYYFLGHKLYGNIADRGRKQIKADNTFLLALDGDVDFQPRALQLLVDRMKKDEKMGAACGRIHPIGSGPMVWYQKFEYALGHWMQKATEHVLGCVLCSPGCFSLFRGSALMDENVMRRYTTESTKAKHFVQYDQGEDRWLCTLLLQAGYRVEYSAASDSYTNAPEGFNEFYNQRRRWMPSTMANILDLLMSWKTTVDINENISLLYIAYQAALLVSALLGTAVIFVMIVGSLELALDGAIDSWTSLFINLIPLVIFVVVCFKGKSSTQLWLASILTTAYGLIQMIVFIGILIQIAEDGACAPTSLFFFYVSGTLILAALLHPQEVMCIVHGMVYFIAIPSMYMLLMIYALCNLHVVSWGTREVKVTPTEQENKDKHELEKKEKDSGLAAVVAKIRGMQKETGFSFSLGSLFRCVYCPKEVKSDEAMKMELILVKLDQLEKTIEKSNEAADQSETPSKKSKGNILRKIIKKKSNARVSWSEDISEDQLQSQEACSSSDEDVVENDQQMAPDELKNPFWAHDKDIGGKIVEMERAEVYFFQDLISKYLYPLEKNKEQEERIANELLELRDKVAFGYLFVNAILTVTLFTLQANVDRISVPWPCGSSNLRLEPLAFIFLIFFGIIMLIQTFGMLAHRMGTLLHIVASTTVNFFEKTDSDIDDNLALVGQMNQLGQLERRNTMAQSANEDNTKSFTRRKTVAKIERKQNQDAGHALTLDEAFMKRLDRLKQENTEEIEKKMGFMKQRERMKSKRAIKKFKDRERSRATSRATAQDHPGEENLYEDTEAMVMHTTTSHPRTGTFGEDVYDDTMMTHSGPRYVAHDNVEADVSGETAKEKPTRLGKAPKPSPRQSQIRDSSTAEENDVKL